MRAHPVIDIDPEFTPLGVQATSPTGSDTSLVVLGQEGEVLLPNLKTRVVDLTSDSSETRDFWASLLAPHLFSGAKAECHGEMLEWHREVHSDSSELQASGILPLNPHFSKRRIVAKEHGRKWGCRPCTRVSQLVAKRRLEEVQVVCRVCVCECHTCEYSAVTEWPVSKTCSLEERLPSYMQTVGNGIRPQFVRRCDARFYCDSHFKMRCELLKRFRTKTCKKNKAVYEGPECFEPPAEELRKKSARRDHRRSLRARRWLIEQGLSPEEDELNAGSEKMSDELAVVKGIVAGAGVTMPYNVDLVALVRERVARHYKGQDSTIRPCVLDKLCSRGVFLIPRALEELQTERETLRSDRVAECEKARADYSGGVYAGMSIRDAWQASSGLGNFLRNLRAVRSMSGRPAK
jgi:hypothetical protein